jgi:hypothetical protein
MNEQDTDRFAGTIAALAIATRGDVDDATIELYFRALIDVPFNLLEAAAVELARESVFFPRPAEWRVAVDKVLDRQARLRALDGPRGQLQLPGEVGNPDDYRCPDCDNTSWVVSDEDGSCSDRERCEWAQRGRRHTHRCVNAYCVERRRQAREAQRRYSRRSEN